MKNNKGLIHILVTVLVIVAIAIIVGGYTFYRHFWIDAYKGDFEKLVEGSGVVVSNVSCKQVGFNRNLACTYTVSKEDLNKIINHFDLEQYRVDPQAPSLYINEKGERTGLFTDLKPCKYSMKDIKNGAKLFTGHWVESKKGAGLTTYSGATLIDDPASVNACIILNIAFG